MESPKTGSPIYSSPYLGAKDTPPLADPAYMSPLAMMAELRYYGADIPIGSSNHRDNLEKALINARRGASDKNMVRDSHTQQQQGEGENFESLLRRLLDDDYQVAAVDLSGCRIGDVGASRLADALSDNKHVRQLWLRGCAIGNLGAKALALCLEQNMSIVDLFLADNDIGDEGLVAISDALASSNSTLISLEFDDNDVAEDGLDAFIHSLTMNSTLLVASFENNRRLALDNLKRINIVKEMLAEKRNNFELFDFVVDLNADDVSVSNLDVSSGFVDRSVCSSYIPSTSMSVGVSSQALGAQSNLTASGDSTDSVAVKIGSFRFSIYNKSFHMAKKIRIKTPKVFRRHKRNPHSASRVPLSLSRNERTHITMPLKTASSRGQFSLGTESVSTNGLASSNMEQIIYHTVEAQRYGYRKIPLVRSPRWQTAEMSVPNDALLQSRTAISESIKNPETQSDFNTVVTQSWRQIETMRSENRLAAEHYRARHVWFWYVPISSTLLTVTLLSLASALELAGKFPVDVESSDYFRLGLGVSCVFFSCVAFALNSTQSKVGWSTHASIHRSIEVELDQVAFRLDKLGKYEGQGLTFGTHLMRGGVDAIRALYRIDFYLQTIQRCSPPIPRRLYEIFYLMERRLKRIHAVKMRMLHGGESGDSDPVPLEVHFDALDLLRQEIEKYYFFPLFIPEAHSVVTRTIDKLFSKNREGNNNNNIERRGDSSEDEIVDTVASTANPVDTSATELNVGESSVANAQGNLEKMAVNFTAASVGTPANPFEAKDPARGAEKTDGIDKNDSILPTNSVGVETPTSSLQQQTGYLDKI
ncbi:hypothetical protein ACHAXA_010861 [Cyclostephanos tholiformis]|uniref:Uncharacterized protein n=1 Tax=Cyclostephanos tholiformis TaxID=382380 RepID=A0ABD3SCY3_9STRA